METAALAAAGRDPTGVVAVESRFGAATCVPGSDKLSGRSRPPNTIAPFSALADPSPSSQTIDADQLEIYVDLADIKRTFDGIRDDARTIVLESRRRQAPNAMKTPSSTEVIRFGISRTTRASSRRTSSRAGRLSFRVVYDEDKDLGPVALKDPGRHKSSSARRAIVGPRARRDGRGMAKGLDEYNGVERRFRCLASIAGVVVIDDYAHNPAKVQAALETARIAYPGLGVIADFQHPSILHAPREFAREFGLAGDADEIFLTETLSAREQPMEGVTAARRRMRASLGPRPLRGAAEARALADTLIVPCARATSSDDWRPATQPRRDRIVEKAFREDS